MAKSAAQFLDILEARRLLSAAQVESLRRQLQSANPPPKAEVIARLLVQKQVLTETQVIELLAPAPRAAAVASSGWRTEDEVVPLEAMDDLEPLGDELMPLDADLLGPLDASGSGDFTTLGPVDLAAPRAKQATRAKSDTAAPTSAQANAPRRRAFLGPILGGLALVAIVGGGVLWLLLPPSNGESALAPALADYQAGQYALAAEKCEAFLTAYPKSDLCGAARVHLAASRLLDAQARRTPPQELLAQAEALLPPIAGEPTLGEVEKDIAPVLVDLVSSLAKSAEESGGSGAETLLADAHRALVLAGDGRLLPGSLRPWQKLALIEERLAAAAHRSGREARLTIAQNAMRAAIEKADLTEALRLRRRLLASDPELADDASLRDLGSSLALAAAQQVEPIQLSAIAETSLHPSPVAGSVSFASRVADGTTARQTVVVATPTALWALDAASGGTLWRRPAAGYPAAWCLVPTKNQARVAVFDEATEELSVVAAVSGDLQWRLPIGAPLAGAPVAAGGNVIVATRAGQIIALDAASGDVRAAVQLPVSPRAGPAVTADGAAIAVAADELFAYVLSAETLACSGAYYTGHAAGTVHLPPVLLPPHVVIVADHGLQATRLHVLPLAADKADKRSAVQRIDLVGRVATPAAAFQGKLHVVTSEGTMQSFSVTADSARPLKKEGELPIAAAQHAASYLAPAGSSLWLAGRGLARLQSQGGDWSVAEFPEIDGPVQNAPQVVGEALLVLQPGAAPDQYAASLVGTGGKVLWQTTLGKSPRSGKLPDDLAAAIIVPIDEQASAIKQPVPGELAAPPLAWSGGRLAACRDGSVWLLDPDSGQPQAAPLQLPLEIGRSLERCELAAASKTSPAAFVCLPDGRLFSLEVKQQPLAHVAIRAAFQLPAPPAGGMAAAEKSLLVTDVDGAVHALDADTLAVRTSVSLGDDLVAWGPRVLADRVLLGLASGELIAMNSEAEVAWRAPLRSAPVGDAALLGEQAVLVLADGMIVALDLATGKLASETDVAQPLAGGPVVSGAFLVVPTTDGTLLKCQLAGEGAAP